MTKLKTKKAFCLYLVIFAFCTLFSATSNDYPSNYHDKNTGTLENPYLISNLANLRWLSETEDIWGGLKQKKYFFIQTADIDASETVYWNNGEGFRPIGSRKHHNTDEGLVMSAFYGNYNGNNFSINNLYIRHNTDHFHAEMQGFLGMSVGLFGATINSTIENVRLENVNIYGYGETSAIVGYAENSLIRNCSSTGRLSGFFAIGLGGLVGIAVNTQIINSFSEVNISIENAASVGGLVGILWDRSSIKNSYFLGEISTNSSDSGGIVGIGGIIVPIFDKKETVSTIENVYVSGSSKFVCSFGLVGRIVNVDIKDSFWDEESTGIKEPFLRSQNNKIKTMTGLTTAKMKKKSTYKNWDFKTIWDIHPEKNNGFPFLRCFDNF